MDWQSLKIVGKKPSSLLKQLGKEDGSATVEFVAIALPLFLPLFLYLASFSHLSDHQANMHTLAREMARAFVTSENDEVADRVVYEVFVKGANVLGYGIEVGSGQLSYTYLCNQRPCISPNNKITITVRDSESGLRVSTVEYVSPWA